MLDPGSLERLVPDDLGEGITGQETLGLHLERYRFAAQHTLPGRFLDIACGVGYGARLVLEEASSDVVGVGVDISAQAISYARSRYGHERLHFEIADAMEFTDHEGFETIISLETIEHVPEPASFVAHIRNLLKPAGVIIASVPVTPSTDANPHHRTDFSERSLRALLREWGLNEIDSLLQVQKYSPATVFSRRERRTRDVRSNLLAYYLRHPHGLARRLYATLRYGFSNRYLTLVLRDKGTRGPA